MSESDKPRASRKGLFWAFVPVGLLGGLLGMHFFLLAGVLDDPSFSVESDYYQKALSWDAKMAQDRENARLGWSARLDAASAPGRVLVLITAPGDVPVERARVSLEGFHNARASHVLRAELEETSPGRYEAALAFERPGLWEFRVVAERGTDKFNSVIRSDIRGGASP